MRAVVKTGPGPGVVCMDVERPKPKLDEVLIRVHASAVCGTDLGLYRWNAGGQSFAGKFQVKWPLTLGHEFSGVIVETGAEVKDHHVGERVSLETHLPCGKCFNCLNDMAHNCMDMGAYGTSCNGSFAEYAIGPANVVFTLPDGISFEEGALLEPGGVAMRAVDEAAVLPGETVVVNGCGPIGLLTILILRAGNAAQIIAADMDEYRLKMAERFGAVAVNIKEQDVVSEVRKRTAFRGGADVVIETSGAPAAYQVIFRMLRLEGRLITVGHPGGEVSVNWMEDINLRGLSVKGVFGRRIWRTWYQLTSLMAAGRVRLLDVVTHRYQMSQAEEAFEQAGKGAGKILLLPDNTI